ncbi:hypothetical protein [Amycolatopsis minnesotensis]|uniref:Uncharacterized protein n=1 Tax=Amycolatopsis minnesotensis TaxID=337894 RepID=A0ABN2SAZ2_9PSEU
MSDNDSGLPGDLHAALQRHLPDPADDPYHRNPRTALAVLDRLRPHFDDFDDVVQVLFPYDGPHSRDTVIDAAVLMARTGRYLNNATQRRAPLDQGSTVGAIIGNVKAVLYQFEQLLEQLADGAMRLADDPTLYSDQVAWDQNVPREQRMKDRHDAGVTTAMHLADQLRQIRGDLVTRDSAGFRPISGIAPRLDEPTALANQLGHTIDDHDDSSSA